MIFLFIQLGTVQLIKNVNTRNVYERTANEYFLFFFQKLDTGILKTWCVAKNLNTVLFKTTEDKGGISHHVNYIICLHILPSKTVFIK